MKGIFGRSKKPITQAGIIDKTNLQKLEVITGGSDIEVYIHEKPFIDIVFQTFETGPQLKTRHDDTTATVEAVGVEESFRFSSFNQPRKCLQIRVPLHIAEVWNIRTGSGDVVIPKMRAAIFHGITGSGDWDLSDIKAKELRLNASSGDMVVDDAIADTIQMSVTSGDAELRKAKGNVVSGTSHSGELTLKGVYSEKCTVNVTSGDVAIDDLQASEIQLVCTSGDVNTENIIAKQAFLKATSGDIRYSFTGDGSIEGYTTSGDMSLVCKNKQPNATIDVRTSSGDIDTNLSNSIQRNSHNHLAGVVGSGEYCIQLEATSGDVGLWYH